MGEGNFLRFAGFNFLKSTKSLFKVIGATRGVDHGLRSVTL